MPWNGAGGLANVQATPNTTAANPFAAIFAQPKPALSPYIAAPTAVVNTANTTNNNGNGSGSGNGDTSNPPPAPPKTDTELLAEDAAFQAQLNALRSASAAYEADVNAQQQTYDTNYRDSLRKLGFKGDVGAIEKGTAPNEGDWNQTDVTTASGRDLILRSMTLLPEACFSRLRMDVLTTTFFVRLANS
jgi:hypothetical protein